jgi:hypothetical protein
MVHVTCVSRNSSSAQDYDSKLQGVMLQRMKAAVLAAYKHLSSTVCGVDCAASRT